MILTLVSVVLTNECYEHIDLHHTILALCTKHVQNRSVPYTNFHGHNTFIQFDRISDVRDFSD